MLRKRCSQNVKKMVFICGTVLDHLKRYSVVTCRCSATRKNKHEKKKNRKTLVKQEHQHINKNTSNKYNIILRNNEGKII